MASWHPVIGCLAAKKIIKQLEKHLRYPLVVKPVYGVYSAYVVRVNNRAELEETYDYIRNNIKSFWRTKDWISLDLLVEEYIDGEEVDRTNIARRRRSLEANRYGW